MLQDPISIDAVNSDVNEENVVADNQGVVEAGLMEQVAPTVEKARVFFKELPYRSKKRRMRSSETHFLDHPLMGVLIQVRRVN
ncbi:CsiV family protein [Vibrio sinaloensis]|nr:CsiV family protein [Vibrio sinaloensis]